MKVIHCLISTFSRIEWCNYYPDSLFNNVAKQSMGYNEVPRQNFKKNCRYCKIFNGFGEKKGHLTLRVETIARGINKLASTLTCNLTTNWTHFRNIYYALALNKKHKSVASGLGSCQGKRRRMWSWHSTEKTETFWTLWIVPFLAPTCFAYRSEQLFRVEILAFVGNQNPVARWFQVV